jgi:hypothetical protein
LQRQHSHLDYFVLLLNTARIQFRAITNKRDSMRITFAAAALLLLLTVSESALARPEPAAAAAPAQRDINAWHQDLVARYQQVQYFDLSGQPMAADAFLAVLAKRSSSLTMTVAQPDEGKIISLRLIPTPAPK